MTVTKQRFDSEAGRQAFELLRSRATSYAVIGVLIAIVAVIAATVLVCGYVYDALSVETIIIAHRDNIALWGLDAMPFVFAIWGQYVSLKMAYEAGDVVDDAAQDLQQCLDEARASSQAATDRFARVSHELRSPINAIIGMSDLVLSEPDPEQRRHHAQVIRDSAAGLLSLVNDILDYSKIEAGYMELDAVEFDLHDTIKSAAALLDQTARGKGLHLECTVADTVPRRVGGDPGRLRQIVINLLSNAIKFTERGWVAVRVTGADAPPNGGHLVQFEIADTGLGIDAADQPYLFEPYRQASGSKTQGTGLGLSITRELVRTMGGSIDVESNPGRGSAFRFDVQLRPASTETVVDRSEIELDGRRVLVADPDPGGRASLERHLRELGMEVTTVADGEEGKRVATAAAEADQPFDLVLADMFLPELSGEELGRLLKQRPYGDHTVCAIMTAAGARGDAKRCSEAGFAGYLTHPIPTEYLGELVAAMIATQQLPETERRRQGLVTRYHVRAPVRHTDPVLVVDDSEINREIAVGHLDALGVSSDTVASGEEAIEALRDNKYAAVLLDLQLPDVDGDRVVKTIREFDAPHGDVPVLMLTAGVTDSERQRCSDAGADEFVVKPIERDHLWSALAPRLTRDVERTSSDKREARRLQTPRPSINPRLARMFLQEAEDRLDEIRSAAKSSSIDRDRIQRHAHTLKSASCHFPENELTDAAARLERIAPVGHDYAIQAQIAAVESAWDKLRPQLQSVVEKAQAG